MHYKKLFFPTSSSSFGFSWLALPDPGSGNPWASSWFCSESPNHESNLN